MGTNNDNNNNSITNNNNNHNFHTYDTYLDKTPLFHSSLSEAYLIMLKNQQITDSGGGVLQRFQTDLASLNTKRLKIEKRNDMIPQTIETDQQSTVRCDLDQTGLDNALM